MKILLVDNYDSFTFNIAHLFRAVDSVELLVKRNDEDLLAGIADFDGIIIGPGPGSPEDPDYFGQNLELIEQATVPLLGICLGFQGLAHAYGASLKRAVQPMHGKTSPLEILSPHPVLNNISNDSQVMRYHSLMIDDAHEMPQELVTLAEVSPAEESVAANGREIMAIAHTSKPQVGVQFHPESFATDTGKTLAENFITMIKGEGSA